PLLLTMITTVHRYRGALPGSRIQLYAEICQVFLDKRDQIRNLSTELKPDQKQRVLQALAYHMMSQQIREITLVEACEVITNPLTRVQGSDHPLEPADFLKRIENRSGLLVERSIGVLTFAHKTFQEFLCAVHIQEVDLRSELIQHLDDDWWYETIRLYCARVDASELIDRCLNISPLPTSRLLLALECVEDARECDQHVRDYLKELVDHNLESDDPERCNIAAEATLALRLRRSLFPLTKNTFADTNFISYAEFQLFLNEQPDFTPDHWQQARFPANQGKQPAIGITPNSTQEFCDWLTDRDPAGVWLYRLPRPGELTESGLYWTYGDSFTLGATSPLKLTLEHTITPFRWRLADDHHPHPKLKERAIILEGYQPELVLTKNLSLLYELIRNALIQNIASARADAIDIDSYIARALGNDKDLDSTLDIAITHNIDIPHDLARARNSALRIDFAIARTLDIANAIRIGRAHARDLADYIVIIRSRDSAFTHISTLTKASTLASALANAFGNLQSAKSKVDWTLIQLYQDVAWIIYSYIYLTNLMLPKPPSPPSPVKLLREYGQLDHFRQQLIEQANTLADREPRRLPFGNNPEWEDWNNQINALLEAYATLCLLERRRRGDPGFEPFEGIRIVKERRKPE
ncbi:MAG TPA: hypothetical protein VHL11_22675, partial [Phototrophicaceae bacterium]|nr:hypothetical protein [Phototrophicaceae bacterium]